MWDFEDTDTYIDIGVVYPSHSRAVYLSTRIMDTCAIKRMLSENADAMGLVSQDSGGGLAAIECTPDHGIIVLFTMLSQTILHGSM